MEFKIAEKTNRPTIELFLKNNANTVSLYGRDNKGSEKEMMEFKNGKFERICNAYLEGLITNDKGQIYII